MKLTSILVKVGLKVVLGVSEMKTFGVVARLKAPESYVGLWINIYKRGDALIPGGGYKKRVWADRIAK